MILSCLNQMSDIKSNMICQTSIWRLWQMGSHLVIDRQTTWKLFLSTQECFFVWLIWFEVSQPICHRVLFCRAWILEIILTMLSPWYHMTNTLLSYWHKVMHLCLSQQIGGAVSGDLKHSHYDLQGRHCWFDKMSYFIYAIRIILNISPSACIINKWSF